MNFFYLALHCFDRDLKGDDSFDCGVPGFVNTS